MTNSQQSPRWVLGLTSVATFMVALDALVVSTALSTIRVDLGTSIGQLEWTVDAYLLSFAVLMMTASALGDRFGRRRLFVLGIALFAAASAACALAPDVGWLIAGRTVQGAGAAFVMPLALALLGTAFGPERRPWAMGVFSSVIGFSMVCGPLVGGAVVQGISWPWIFWLNVPIAAILIVLARTRIDESYGPPAALDPRGLALVTGSGFGLVWGLVRGNAAGWGSTEVLVALVAGALLAAAFVAVELRAREPMLPLRLFGSRAFSAGNGAAFLWSASLLGTLFFVAQFLQTALGHGPLAAGLLLMPWGVAVFLVPLLAGRLIARAGERPIAAGGMALQAAGTGWIALIAQPDVAYLQLLAPLVVSGVGFALAIPAIQSAVLDSVEPRHIGKASGTLSTMRQLGGVFGIAVLAAVFAGAGSYASPQAFSDGFVAAMGASGGLALAGAFACLALPGRQRRSAATRTPSATSTAPMTASSARRIRGRRSAAPARATTTE
jgi:EmrB/QacA subfamily drug resistance transporter